MCFFLEIFCHPKVVENDFANGVVSCTNANHYESVCFFRCDDGYRLIGESRRVCQENQNWSGLSPVCQLGKVVELV